MREIELVRCLEENFIKSIAPVKSDFQRVLDTQRSKVQAQDQLTATQGSVLINLIATYKALGGGWEFRFGKDFLPQEILREMSGRTDWGALLETSVSGETNGGSQE